MSVSRRKPGQRKENYDDESTVAMLKIVKQLIKSGWGGKDPIEQVQRKMLERGVKCGVASAAAIVEVIGQQIEGVRKGVFPRLDESIRRLTDDAVCESIEEELP